MRVLQLIDSLRPGGAEKMAVTYANALANRIEDSFLCCTRLEGLLKKQLSPEVGYLYLNRTGTFDIRAFLKLRKFVQDSQIDLIQAHSSSYFIALLIKFNLPHVKLVWHDHYGRELVKRKPGLLKLASRKFDGIISVNSQLEQWSKDELEHKDIRYFPNFIFNSIRPISKKVSHRLQGEWDAFKIVCVANLRPQKDHLTLLKAFQQIIEIGDNITLHLIGKDKEDSYSWEVKNYIYQNKLEGRVFLYGERAEVSIFIEEADLSVLSSVSEGLPVAILEYGAAGLPVVCTDVGQCKDVIGNDGQVVSSGDAGALARAIKFYIENEDKRDQDAAAFHQKIKAQYTENARFPEILDFFQQVLRKK